jgi:flagellar biosynthesis/type III secretory pathway M-ring protein FliF/YscJ
MDVFKAQLEKIKQQLAGLTATQRMLVGTLVAVMVLTLLYWGHYASNAEMSPLLDQSLSPAEIGRISQELDFKGVNHTVVGDKVMVPADRKMELVADLMYADALPVDLHSVFDEVNKNLNPFSSPTEREATYNQAREMMLSQIIARFPKVADCQVMINAKNERRVEATLMPSATIVLKLREPMENPKPLVVAAADSVAHAVSGLTRGHISVVVDGRSIALTDPEDDPLATGMELMDQKIKLETIEAQKIYTQFGYIPNLLVSVSVQINNETTEMKKHTYDKAATLSIPKKEDTQNEENTAAPAAPADPGVGANTGGISVPSAAGGGGQSTTSSKESTENEILPSDVIETTQIPAGKDTVQSATVRVPRSYFVSVYKMQNPKAKDPDEAAIQGIATAQLASIREGVKTCLFLKSDDAISADMYPDIAIPGAMAMAVDSSSTGGSLPGSVSAYGKQIAVGVLAVISLFMMSSMVKKATPAPVVALPPEDESPAILNAGEGLAGEVGTTDATLDGMEMDEDAIKTQQMLDQVSTMVKENPDGAAALVKRWLNRT